MENRRRAERQSAVWLGICQVEGDLPHMWRDCGVFDFSKLGLGMDLRHPDASALIGRYISVQIQVGAFVDMIITGEVRNVKAGPEGIVRAGLEFVGLSSVERSMLDLLEREGTLRGGPYFEQSDGFVAKRDWADG